MNRFDTLKMQFSTGSIEGFNKDCFEIIETKGYTKGSQKKYELWRLEKEKKPLGISSILINPDSGTVSMEFSSKVLKENYFDLIHKNNINETVQKINKTGIIKLNSNRFIDSSEMFRFDACYNLRGIENDQSYINALNVIALSNKDVFTRPYEREGISFKYKAKNNKTQSRTYPKYPEMKKKKNRAIVEHTGLDCFKNVLRPETQYIQFKEMRKVLNLAKDKTITLQDILESNEPILYKSFSDILKFNPEQSTEKIWSLEMREIVAMITADDSLSMNETRKQLGDLLILKYFKDLDSVNAFLASKVKGNISKYKREYQNIKVKTAGEKEIKQVNDFIEQLKTAA